MTEVTNKDLCDRLDKMEKMIIAANDDSERLAKRLNGQLDNFDGFVKTVYFLGKAVFILGVIWAIVGEKLTNIVGG